MNEPRPLLDQFLEQFWEAVGALSTAAASSPSLVSLRTIPEYAGAPFNGRVLDRIESLAVADPLAVAGFALLRALAPAAMAPTDAVRLHGWDPLDGRARSIALVLHPPNGPPCDIALALVKAPDGSPTIQLVASAPSAAGGLFDAGSALKMHLQASAVGALELEFRPGTINHFGGAPTGELKLHMVRAEAPPVVVGTPGGPGLSIHGLTIDLGVALTGSGAEPKVTFALAMDRVDVDVLPALIAGLLGGTAQAQIALDLRADSAGLQLGPFGGTRALVTNQLPTEGLRIDNAGVDLLSDGPAAVPLRLGITLTVNGRVAGLPVSFGVDGVGAAFGFCVGRNGTFGFDPSHIAALPPIGIAAELALPFAKGAGFLTTMPDGAFLGAFDLDLGFVAVRALAVLQPGDKGRPLSLAVLISANFPPPGVQLGLGFSLVAIGGIVAINRRTDFPALETAVLDGRAGALLSPSVARTNPAAALAALLEIFPEAPGHFVIGPSLQLAWGGRLITASISLIFDLPNPPTCALLGRLTVAIPDPAAPLILIGLTFLARFDPSIPSARITGTLTGSHIVFLPLQGDAFMLVAAGRNSNLVISAGGFHPQYPRPAGTPALRRISFELCPLPVPRMRAEMYFALTANSVQFGASVYLAAKLADCGIEGRFSYDALCVFAPHFAFKAHAEGRVAVEAFGETLIAVSLDILLEGPSPWHVRGRGSVSVLWEDLSLNFEESWGSSPPQIEAAPDIETDLRNALVEPRSWLPDSLGTEHSGVILRRARRGQQALLHPLGRLQARQQRLPFNIVIQRYNGAQVAPQLWEIVAAGVSNGQEIDDLEERGHQLPIVELLRDEFPRAHYFELNEGDQLAALGFTQEVSGAMLTPSVVTLGKHIECPDNEFDEKTIMNRDEAQMVLPNRRRNVDRMSPTTRLFDAILGSRKMHEEAFWWTDDGKRAVVVKPTQPLTIASVVTLKEQPLPGLLEGSEVHAAQVLALAVKGGLRNVQLVERWEVEDVL